jgi:predicted ester cyclase
MFGSSISAPPASGRDFAFTGMVFWRVRDGKIAERWAEIDFGTLERMLRG